jgi:hypothetical protein
VTGWDTGFPQQDAQSDFNRARRRSALERLANRLRREPDDVEMVLPFEEVVAALGRTGERRLGLKSIELDSIVGTIDRSKDFDRSFRPTSGRVRQRWERLAVADRRGESFPPIAVLRIGDVHFVEDGHHRVSIARARGRTHIDAYVTEVQTRVGAERDIRLGDLPFKGHERLFRERVPLPAEAVPEIRVSDPWAYGTLAEAVEAWGFRAMQERGELMTREEVAGAWLEEEYRPVVAMLREAGMLAGKGTETERYMAIVSDRYRFLRTHEWDEDVLERLRTRRR